MKKVLALILTLCLVLSCLISGSVAFASDYALIRYIPTKLTVSDEEVAVEGCFVNMNKSGTLTGFQNFCMEVYVMDELLLYGEFGNIDGLRIKPMDMVYHTFIFEGPHDMVNGTYTCDDTTFAITYAEAFDFS